MASSKSKNKIPDHLAHFTTMGALAEMLRYNTPGSTPVLHFRATIYDKMNDGNEVEMLQNRYFTESKFKQDFKIGYTDWLNNNGYPFIISFIVANISDSNKSVGQNVPMWLNYGHSGQGIALVFDFPKECLKAKNFVNWHFDSCKYCDYNDISGKIIELNNKTPLDFSELNSSCCLTKSKSWEYENEWRMYSNVKRTETDIYVRNDGTIVECAFVDIPLEYLKKIYLGNRLDYEKTKRVIHTILAKYGCTELPKIVQSKLKLQ